MTFDPKKFEPKWQAKWAADGIYKADNNSEKPPQFVMDMFPYPSGSSMHVGHPRGYVATDVYARFKRMSGFNVLHPMGWDAFGLPAEETAIENKEYPTVTVERNIEKFKTQLNMMGLGYDWSRELNTTDPEYYKHTQRIFLEFFKRGLAINKTVPVNWCPELGTVLANEDIVDGKSERGGFPVFQMPMRQWILKITDYADRLVDDLELLTEWPEKIKNAQRAWIGRSEGYELDFPVGDKVIRVFTTKLETISGATFVVLAPEHELVAELLATAHNTKAIADYLETVKQKTNLDRQVSTEKTGVIVDGVTATNPYTGQQVPILIADYVLASYGTGAVMAVPSLDERDAEMAKVLDLPLGAIEDLDEKTVAKKVNATPQKKYKIRDWVFSRQRFWGEPFPIVWVAGRENYDAISKGEAGEWFPKEVVSYIDEAGEHGPSGTEYFAVPVIPKYLKAMQLPKVDSYEPTGNIEGPLAGISQWVNAQINPKTGELKNVDVAGPEDAAWIPARRETNTMPQWAGSSWYWLRFMDPENTALPFSPESAKYWGPVNVYAGADHAVAHLIYARFWYKVMQDAGMVDFPEPFSRLEFLGYILSSDGTKISKRKGNSRSPEEVVGEVGADAFRLYEMFIGPFEKAIPWQDNDLRGARKFLDRVWRFGERVISEKALATEPEAERALHKAISKVSNDIETFKFNTGVASLMVALNEMQDRQVTVEDFKIFLKLLSPIAPHMTEELWANMGENQSIHISQWPNFNPELVKEETISLPVQINGKHRADIEVAADISEEELKSIVLADAKVQKYLVEAGVTEPTKFIYVAGRIVNIVL